MKEGRKVSLVPACVSNNDQKMQGSFNSQKEYCKELRLAARKNNLTRRIFQQDTRIHNKFRSDFSQLD